MPEILKITEARGTESTAVLRVRGRLDAKSSPQLVQHCEAARQGRKHLVLNLSEVSFLSSSGVGALLTVVERAREDGGSVHLAPLSSAVRCVLDLLNLGPFLTIQASEDQALSDLEEAA